MAPRRSTGVRFKRTISPRDFNRERRTKLREDPSIAPSPPSSPESSPTYVQTQATPPTTIEKPIPLSTRPVTTGRNIDFQFFDSEGFEIGNMLRFQNWEFLCRLSLPTYPNLVREFYANGKVRERSFTSEVKNVKIDLSEELLGEILRIPNEGGERLDDRESGLRLLFGREDKMHFEEVLARDMSIENRLLHHIIARIFVPRIGRFDFVTKIDITLLFHLIKREKFNLPALMLRVMQEATIRGKPALPYGMFLTLVFEHFRIKLEGETNRSLKHFDTYNANSLKRMRFKKVNGQWTKEDELGEPSQPPQPDHPPAPSVDIPSSSPAAAPASDPSAPSAAASAFHLAEDHFEEFIQRMSARVIEHFVPLFESLASRIEDSVSHIDDRVSRIEDTVRQATVGQRTSDPMPSASAPDLD